MTDPSVHDLHYGHFGPAIYDVDDKKWSFARVPGIRRAFQPFGLRQLCIEAPAHDLPAHTSLRKEPFRGLYPELLADEDLLAQDAQVSEAVAIVVSKYDPLRGDLLAFGRAADIDNKGFKRAVRIAAVPGGSAGEALRLVELQTERHGWAKDKSIWLNVPTLHHGETGWWSGDGAPIQQICSACSQDNHSTYLAIRTPRSVYVFHPLFHRLPVAASRASNSRSVRPASRLEASVLANLTLSPDEPTLTDVTFNPDYQRQFATLDQRGNWAVWEIEGRRGKKWGYKTVKAKSGQLLDDKDEMYDGWGRLLWVNNVATIAVCNRRLLAITDFRGTSVQVSASSLRLEGSVSWILDLRRDPRDGSRILVLTSTHLSLLKVSILDDGAETQVDAHVLLSWRHFRNVEDITLQISVVVDNEDMVVFLRSLQDPIVTTFRYAENVELAPILISSSDPTEVVLSGRSTAGLHVEALGYSQDPHATGSCPGNEYSEGGILFYTFFLLSPNLEISSRFAYIYDPASDARPSSQRKHTIEMPSWIKRTIHQSSSRVLADDFVVPDDLADVEDEAPNAPWLSVMRRPRRKRRGLLPNAPLAKSVDSRTVDKSRVCRRLRDAADEEKEDSNKAMAGLATRLNAVPDYEQHHNDTLWQLSGGNFDVGDIDETASAFVELLQSSSIQNDEEASLIIKPIGYTLAHQEDGLPSILATYNGIIELWLTTMPKETPGRVRLANERLARSVAAQLCLSSATLRIQEPEPAETAETGENPQLTHGDGSMVKGRGRATPDPLPCGSSQSSVNVSSGYSSQPAAFLPTPEATPSLASVSSSVFTFSDGSFARLNQYTTFTKRQPTLPRQMNSLLSHWTPGSDPVLYDWDAARATAENMDRMEVEGMSKEERRERAKANRKRERLLKKQRYQSQKHEVQSASQTPQVQHSQRPQHPRSSPGPSHFSQMAYSSQMASSQMVPSTQVERGAHGGRPKKKVKRMQGF